MASSKQLGIDVKINLPSATSIKEELNKTWQQFKDGYEAKIKVGVDKNSLKSVKSTINTFLKEDKFNVKVKFDTTESIKDLTELTRNFSKLKSNMEEVMQLKIDPSKFDTGSISKAASATNTSLNESVSQYKEMEMALKEVASLEKERFNLMKKSQNSTGKVSEVYKEQAEAVEDVINAHIKEKELLEKTTAGQLSKLNTLEQEHELKLQNLQAIKDAKQFEAENAEFVKTIISLEKERYDLLKKSQNAAPLMSEELRNQASEIEKTISSYTQENDVLNRVNNTQKEQLNTIREVHNAELEKLGTIQKVAEADKIVLDAKKQVYNVQQKISDLELKSVTGGLSDKERAKLIDLQAELIIKKQLLESAKKESDEIIKQKNHIQDNVNNLKEENNERKEIATSTSKITDEQKNAVEAVRKINASLDEQLSITKQLATAGDSRASELQEQLSAAKKVQAQAEETLNSNRLITNEIKEQVEARKQNVRQAEREANAQQSGTESDTFRQSGIYGQLLNPRDVISNAKQAFSTIYQDMASIDKQIVNIQKVADVPSDVLEEFNASLYDQASAVGKTAEEFGASVERWLTAGKTLQESQELGHISTMGAFVGNIDEGAMVDYMSVPLNAWKNAGLEAEDVINSMNEVANNNAIEMEDLGAAYEKSAATVSGTKTSFAELTGMISGAQEATRAGGDKIGTALKAISLNFSKFGAELTAADQEKLHFFEGIGVQIKDGNGELNSTYEITRQLAEKWGTLNTEQQATASFYAAGKNHSTVLQGMMQNWEGISKAAGEAQGQVDLYDKESGSAFQEFAKQQDSIEFKTAEAKNAWSELLNTIAGGRDGVNGVLDIVTDVLKKLNEFASNETVRELAPEVLKIVGALTAFQGLKIGGRMTSTMFDDMGKTFSTLHSTGSKFIGLFTSSTKLTAKAGIFGTLAKGASGFGKVLGTVFPAVGLVTTALTVLDAAGVPVFETLEGLVGGLIDKFHESKKAAEEYKEKQDELAKEASENKFLNGTLAKADETSDKFADLIEQKEKLSEESGGKIPLSFSDSEFEQLQGLAATISELTGIDIELEFNDYGYIKSQFADLLEDKAKLESSEMKKAMKTYKELSKGSGLADGMDDFMGIQNDNLKALIEEKNNMQNDFDMYGDTLPADQQKSTLDEISRLEKEIAGYKKNAYFYDEKGAEAVKSAKEADEQRLNNLNDLKKNMMDQLKSGYLGDAINGMDEGDKKTAKAVITSGLKDTIDEQKEVAELFGVMQKAQEDYLSEDKVPTILDVDQISRIKDLLGDTASSLSSNSAEWFNEDGSLTESVAAVISQLTELNESGTKNVEDLKTKFRELAPSLSLTDADVDSMLQGLEQGGIEAVKIMAQLGEDGAAALNVGTSLQAYFETTGKSWKDGIIELQQDLEGLSDEDREVSVKLGLEDEAGIVNGTLIEDMLSLPEDVVTKYSLIDDEGNISVENTLTLLKDINGSEFASRYTVDGLPDLEKFTEYWNGLDEDEQKEYLLSIGADTSQAEIDAKKAADDIANKFSPEVKFKFQNITEGMFPTIPENSVELTVRPVVSRAELEAQIEKDTPVSIQIDGEPSEFDKDVLDLITRYNGAQEQKAKVGLDALTTDATDKIAAVERGPYEARINLVAGTIDSVITRYEKGITVDIKKGSGGSVAIDKMANEMRKVLNSRAINPNMNSAMSRSITTDLTNGGVIPPKTTNSATSKYTSSTNDKPATVNEDVWRYWAKELFKGIPLENSMEDLENAISRAGEDISKLIPLYREQIALINKQIAYNTDLRNAQQSELNSILSQLGGYGFQHSGNEITNLGSAKGLSGDRASEAETLLNKYKELYQSINNLNSTISSLKKDQFDINQSIEDAEVEAELKKIEERLKKTEAILTKISNNTSLFEKKMDLVSDADYELKMNVTEEGANLASKNMQELIDEYNSLSTMSVENSENAEELQSQLSSLKDEILTNADSVIEYRNALNQLRIDRFAEDFEKFNSSMESNIDRISNNIDVLKEGLLSGTNFSDLASSDLSVLDFDRKSEFEQQAEERLQLEAELNRILDLYAQKNIERTKNTANAQLQIEKSKYDELLGMISDYTNGKLPGFDSVGNGIDIGITDVGEGNSKDDSEYNEWLEKMKNINNQYSEQMREMTKKYDDAMANASSYSEKEAIRNQFIIDQLKLQESMYQSIIDTNKDAIAQAEKELENTELTTEQRQELLDKIAEYEQANVDAQNSIRESIKDRYDFEFSLMDKAAEKAEQYTSYLQYLMDVADLINLNSGDKGAIYDSIFGSQLNEYAKASDSLQQLLDEQSKFEEGSYEWSLLAEKIQEVKESMQDLTVELLNTNKDILGNALDKVMEDSEKALLGGKTLDEWNRFQDNWVTGIEKEIELDKLRQRMLDLESSVNDEKLEILDKQEAISKKDLEYLDKQLTVMELQEKLANQERERTEQVLVKNDDGTYGWQYQANQDDIDKTKDELAEAEKDLEDYKNEQREEYVNDLSDILDDAKDGKYKNSDELEEALNDLNNVYGSILGDIPGLEGLDMQSILDIYEEYLKNNEEILSNIDQTPTEEDKEFTDKLTLFGQQFEASFKNISQELGEIIGEELAKALNGVNGMQQKVATKNYTIQKQVLEFPNVTDTTGFADVLNDLPAVATQMITSKVK